MRIVRVERERIHVPLSRPYAISGFTTSSVELLLVRVISDVGPVGVGAASPAPEITGETPDACDNALAIACDRLVGQDPRELDALIDDIATSTPGAPAARAALDMALLDWLGRRLELPVVDLLGRPREPLPTSVTIGILDVDSTLTEAAEHVARGFRHLKIKIGRDVDADIERLTRLRERFGSQVGLRVDANEGYTPEQYARFAAATGSLSLELVEQPVPVADVSGVRAVPARLALDESVHDEHDAMQIAAKQLAAKRLAADRACDVFVIKLMKSGGIFPAQRIARLAALFRIDVMWGCMDESVISIAAALHAAYASKATRYLDLDGSFDLAEDPASGGFTLRDGVLSLTGAPGLGVDWPV